MLHLEVPIKAGTSYGTIEYLNPLQKSRSDYYQSTLHSMYSSAAETSKVTVPIKVTIQDSGYIAGVTSEEINENFTIKEYSKIIAKLLSGTSQQRSAKACQKLLKNYVNNPPTAFFDDDANDNDPDSRYFNLNLPKKTFLYCNLKAPLYALGYADDQIVHISNLSDHPGVPKGLIDTAASLGAFSDVNSIYIVDDNSNPTFNPTPVDAGHIKWLDSDKFQDVYFPSKRTARYVAGGIPHQRFRFRRNALPVVLSEVEQKMKFGKGDDKATLLQKLSMIDKFTDFAALAKVEKSNINKPFDISNLDPRQGESAADAKVRYWRGAIVTALDNVTTSAPEPEIVVPDAYFGVDANQLLIPLTTLAEKDSQYYVRIAAESCIISFIATLMGGINRALSSATGAMKENLTQQKRRYNEQSADRFAQKNRLIALYTQERNLRIQQFDSLADNDVIDGEDEITLSFEGLTGTCNETSKSMFEIELGNIIDTNRPLTEEDILTLKDRIHAVALSSSDKIITANDAKVKVETEHAIISKLWEDQVDFYNQFVIASPQKNPAITIDDVNTAVEKVETAELTANNTMDLMMTGLLRLRRSQDQLRCNTFHYSDFVQEAYNNPEKLDESEAVKQVLSAQFNELNGYNADIVKALNAMEESIIGMEEEIKTGKQKISGISEIVTRLNSVYNSMNAGRPIVYPAVMSKNIDELTKIQPSQAPSAEAEDDARPAVSSISSQQSVTSQDSAPVVSIPVETSNPPSLSPPAVAVRNGDGGGSSAPPPPPPPVGSGGGSDPPTEQDEEPPISQDDKGGDEEVVETEVEDDEEDDREEPTFDQRKKYSIGFVHFANDPYIIDSVIEISKNTSATDVKEKLVDLIRDPLLTSNLLNMAFQPRFFSSGDNPKRYGLRMIKEIPLNTSYMQIDLKTRRYANLLRLIGIADNNFKVTVFADSAYQKYSDNFEIVNPFANDFNKHYPLLLGPVNAGPFNAFSTVVGECTSMALVEREGRVRNPIDILMRSAERERYTINFYSATNLEPTVFERDYVLYFHFNIEDV